MDTRDAVLTLMIAEVNRYLEGLSTPQELADALVILLERNAKEAIS